MTPSAGSGALRARWLGTVPYREAVELQRSLHRWSNQDHLLLLEHPPVYTMGVRAKRENLLAAPSEMGAEVLNVDRGGDVTFHGPGQLVAYPILSVPFRRGVVSRYVHSVEQVVIDALQELGVAGVVRREGFPGLWIDGSGIPRKVCAVGVRMSRGRTMHGLALNVSTDLSWFTKIVPCGLGDASVTSLRNEGHDLAMEEIADALTRHAAQHWSGGEVEYQRATPLRRSQSGLQEVTVVSRNAIERDELPSVPVPDSPSPIAIGMPKPSWLRAPARMGTAFHGLKSIMRDLELVTVCEEAGCPNIFECWEQGTATFMINGDRCTRACGFCMVDTRKPLLPDPDEPSRVAEAVARMGLSHAVVTAVARDDLEDGGASGFARTVETIRARNPGCDVELLIPDCKGRPESLDTIFDTRPDVLNHNLETVLRLQRKVRPSANYARSLAVLARAKASGLTVKSGLMVGLGESFEEVLGALADLRGVGVDILTVGQYLRPSRAHLPVERYWTPAEIGSVEEAAWGLGFRHVEASPLARSSYHARGGLQAVAGST